MGMGMVTDTSEPADGGEKLACSECGTTYKNWLTAVKEDNCEGAAYLPDECSCYKCTGPEYAEHDGHEYVVNNMEHHTYGEGCEECGGERTEYKDLGRKGRYVCPDCS